MIMHKLRVYVAGLSPETMKAIDELKELLDEKFQDQYSLEILDLLESLSQAQRDNVIVTPTILRISPLPEKRVIGDIRARESIIEYLFS